MPTSLSVGVRSAESMRRWMLYVSIHLLLSAQCIQLTLDMFTMRPACFLPNVLFKLRTLCPNLTQNEPCEKADYGDQDRACDLQNVPNINRHG